MPAIKGVSRRATPVNYRVQGWEIIRVGRNYYPVQEIEVGVFEAQSSLDPLGFKWGSLEKMQLEAEGRRIKGFPTKHEAISYAEYINEGF